MTDPKQLAGLIRGKAGDAKRFMVAIAGAPASGKSTAAAKLRDELASLGESAIVVPMDGFHFDDTVLNARGHRPRKGAPFTFDVAGFAVLLKRIRAGEPDIASPVFDRALELSRNAADIVGESSRIILIEGNYLLVNEAQWINAPGRVPGAVYVIGNPTLYVLSHRTQAIAFLGWIPEMMLREQWTIMGKQLQQARPVYLYIDKSNVKYIPSEFWPFVNRMYKSAQETAEGTWYELV